MGEKNSLEDNEKFFNEKKRVPDCDENWCGFLCREEFFKEKNSKNEDFIQKVTRMQNELNMFQYFKIRTWTPNVSQSPKFIQF